ncbi:MAG: MoxR family ATPase [Planctomycetes bacterium]|nr:MoxR family ATPase [Planctomycetota bacterium]
MTEPPFNPAAVIDGLRAALRSRVLGQAGAVRDLLAGFVAGGHIVISGEPGVGKNLLAATLAQATSLLYRRIQCTPDLMAPDIVGADVMWSDPRTGARLLKFMPGPLFANVVLAAEITRATPKAQAALLEAMEEGAVTTGGRRHPLPEPFTLLTTAGASRTEGAYTLSTAALDRFLMNVDLRYPAEPDELAVVHRASGHAPPPAGPVASRDDLLALRQAVRAVEIPPDLADRAHRLIRRLRPEAGDAAPPLVREYVRLGPSPRAGQHLLQAARGFAALAGRPAASPADLADAVAPVLRHRLALTFRAENEGVTVTDVLESVGA